jgi:hypothetical protein
LSLPRAFTFLFPYEFFIDPLTLLYAADDRMSMCSMSREGASRCYPLSPGSLQAAWYCLLTLEFLFGWTPGASSGSASWL